MKGRPNKPGPINFSDCHMQTSKEENSVPWVEPLKKLLIFWRYHDPLMEMGIYPLGKNNKRISFFPITTWKGNKMSYIGYSINSHYQREIRRKASREHGWNTIGGAGILQEWNDLFPPCSVTLSQVLVVATVYSTGWFQRFPRSWAISFRVSDLSLLHWSGLWTFQWPLLTHIGQGVCGRLPLIGQSFL